QRAGAHRYRRLGEGFHVVSSATDLQPARRPVRAGTRIVPVHQVEGGQGVLARAGAGDRRAVAPDLQRVPDPAEASELQPRPGDGSAVVTEAVSGHIVRT